MRPDHALLALDVFLYHATDEVEMTTHPETAVLENMLRHALEAFEHADRENVALRRRVHDLEDEMALRDAEQLVRSRLGSAAYRARFHMAMALASLLLVALVAKILEVL